MPLGPVKWYIVNSPVYIKAVEGRTDDFSALPLRYEAASKVYGTSNETEDFVRMALICNKDGIREFQEILHATLGPGLELDAMHLTMMKSLLASFQELKTGAMLKKICLHTWLGNALALAATESVYGQLNPLKDSRVLAAFWFARPVLCL